MDSFLTLLPHIQWFDTCCSVVQIRTTSACGTGTRDYGLAPQHEGQTITWHVFHCKVSVDSVGIKSSFKWPIKTGFCCLSRLLSFIALYWLSYGGTFKCFYMGLFNVPVFGRFDLNLGDGSINSMDWCLLKMFQLCRVQRRLWVKVLFVIALNQTSLALEHFESSSQRECKEINKAFGKLYWLLLMHWEFSWYRILFSYQ